MIKFLAFVLLSAVSSVLFAGDCKKTGTTCIDAAPCKTISGKQVCLSDFGISCWTYEDTYTCIKPNAANYCQPLINAGCWQTGSTCDQMDTVLNTGCMRYTQTWRCGDPATPTPANTIRLDDTYTLISSNYDPGPCQSLANNTNCQIAESRCIQTTPDTPLPPGISSSQVAPDGCYKKQETYACLTGRTDNDCSRYASDPNCTLQSTEQCAPEDLINGRCLYQEQTYRCQTTPPQTKTVTDCSEATFCQDGKCFDTGYPADKDFGLVAATIEAARQAGVYINEGIIFSGEKSKCKVKLFGLANCCKKASGGKSNNDVLTALAIDAGMSVAGQTLKASAKVASAYMYDFMFQSSSPWMVDRAVAAWGSSWFGDTTFMANFKPSVSLYGFSFGFVSAGGSTYSGIFSGWVNAYNAATKTIVPNAFGIEGLNLNFNPYALALSIAVTIIQELMSCEQEEQILAMKRGQKLCHRVGSYCSQKILKICVEKTQSYCCFNSRLAKIINEQGRAQIGKSWGSARSPDCSGFTPDEFAAIDFSRIDLSEFVAEVMGNVNMPSVSGIQQNVQGAVQQKMQNYYQRGTQ